MSVRRQPYASCNTDSTCRQKTAFLLLSASQMASVAILCCGIALLALAHFIYSPPSPSSSGTCVADSVGTLSSSPTRPPNSVMWVIVVDHRSTALIWQPNDSNVGNKTQGHVGHCAFDMERQRWFWAPLPAPWTGQSTRYYYSAYQVRDIGMLLFYIGIVTILVAGVASCCWMYS